MPKKVQKRRKSSRDEGSSPNISVESIDSITDIDQSTSSIIDTSKSYSSLHTDLRQRTGIKQIFDQFKNSSKRQKREHAKAILFKPGKHSLWCEKYFPKDIADICVNKQKVNQVKEAIEDLISNSKSSSRILLLTGPAGSGKSTVAKIIANKVISNKLSLIQSKEGRNAQLFDDLIDTDEAVEEQFPNIIEFSNRTTNTSAAGSPVRQFSDFLDECKLLTMNREKCIIVDELPNLYHEDTLKSFRQAILRWIQLNSNIELPPLIICLTEFDTDDFHYKGIFSIEATFKLETVFDKRLMEYEGRAWKRIKFNPVAHKFLTKALKRVAEGEKELTANIPKKIVTEEIKELSDGGDFRNAIITLEYWCRFLYPVTHSASSFSTLGGVSGLNIFHSIGKIVYGTQHAEEEYLAYMKSLNISKAYDPKGEFTTTPKMDDINSISVENICRDLYSTSEKINLNVLENYLVLNPNMDSDVSSLVDVLSEADILTSFKHDSKSLSMMTYYGCFGSRIMCSKMKKKIRAHGAMRRLKYSRDPKVRRKKRKIEQEVAKFCMKRCYRLIDQGNYSHLSSLNSMLIDGFYQQQILNSSKLKKKIFKAGYRNNTQRLGGGFSNIVLPETSFEPDTNDDDNENLINDNDALMSKLESEYFGGGLLSDREVGPAEQEMQNSQTDEFDDDPIVDSQEERENVNDDSEDWDDSFSDDSLVLKL